MSTDPPHRRRARHFALMVGAILALLGLNPTLSLASASEERQGAELLQGVQAGNQKCQQLSRDQFELIGEYAMGRMVGSTTRHDAMDRQITATSGAAGEVQAHVFMGQRFAGCATGAAPAAFGSMMGMMGTYSGTGAGMMGGSGSGVLGHDGWSATNTVLVILLAVLAAALVALAARGRWRRSSPKTPSDVLNERYARGDIDTADYEQRRHALESLR